MTREGERCLYLIHGSPRAQLADALTEYRSFSAANPADPLAEGLLDVARQVRAALRERRRIMRATGETGKVNAAITLSKEQRSRLARSRKKRLAPMSDRGTTATL